jgi:uncharacterized protein (DUF488 family)
MKEIFTVGHSTHTIEHFLYLLELHKINCVVDVRSTPYSKYASQFNSEQLKKFLKENDMHYIFMGKELGARWEDRSLYTKEGYLDFEKVRKTSLFNSGIKRVEDGIDKGFNIALMCTEKDPIDCHRTILVAPKFYGNGYEVKNILENGDVQTQEDIENRLLDIYFPDRMQVTIFEVLGDKKSDAELIEEAYKLRNRDIGYNIEKEKIEVSL